MQVLRHTNIKKEIQVEEEHITIICEAKKGKLSVEVECSVNRTDPEDYIRSIRKMIKIGEGKNEYKRM